MEEDAPDPAGAQRFAAGLRAHREAQGLSQREVAERMHARGFRYYPQTITKIEASERAVPVEEAVALADELGTTVYALLRPPIITRESYRILSTLRRVRRLRDDANEIELAWEAEAGSLRKLITRAEDSEYAGELQDEISAARRALDYKGMKFDHTATDLDHTVRRPT
jgi:transcriptional regulator with XRE-family HTH domain